MILMLRPVDKGTGDAVPSIVQKILSAFPGNTPEPEEDYFIELLTSTMFGGETAPYLFI